MSLFKNFRQSDGSTTCAMMIDLLLNQYDTSQIERVEVVSETTQGIMERSSRIMYAFTKEAVDLEKIVSERKEITIPIICSVQSYDMTTDASVFYTYKPFEDDASKFRIDDLGIIAPRMVIAEGLVVSSERAKSFAECEHGFSYFMEYVLHGSFKLGNWEVKYDEETKEYDVFYTFEAHKNTESLYHTKEYDKTGTYQLTLYIIKKACEKMVEDGVEMPSDQYEIERWEQK